MKYFPFIKKIHKYIEGLNVTFIIVLNLLTAFIMVFGYFIIICQALDFIINFEKNLFSYSLYLCDPNFSFLNEKYDYKIIELCMLHVENVTNSKDFVKAELMIIHNSLWNQNNGSVPMLQYFHEFNLNFLIEKNVFYHRNDGVYNDGEKCIGFLNFNGIIYDFELYITYTDPQAISLSDKGQLPVLKYLKMKKINLSAYLPVSQMESFHSKILDFDTAADHYFKLKKARGPHAVDHGILLICNIEQTNGIVYSIKPVSSDWLNNNH